jgi:hypothetical protein
MIPYDDLVVALASWRARQGLPVAPLTGASAAARPPAAPVRSAPPHAPPRASSAVSPAVGPELQDFDGDALIEESPYDPAGDDYVVQLGTGVQGIQGVQIDSPGESTAAGSDVITEGLLIPKRGKRQDW